MNIREKILVIEDEKSIARFISTVLSEHGYEAMQARSGNDEIAQKGTYTVGELTIDYNKHQVLKNGQNVRLTLSEFRIVALLGKYAGKVLTYDFIIKELWGPRAGGDNQILRVNMANIRRKIEKNPAEPEYLFTEVGVGYRLAEGD